MLIAWHPPTADSGIFCFNCLKCARTFETWEKCFATKHSCIKSVNIEPLTAAPPANSHRRNSKFVSVFPDHVEKKHANSTNYKRFWTDDDVSNYEDFNSLREPSRPLTFVKHSAIMCSICYRPFPNKAAFSSTCKNAHTETAGHFLITVPEAKQTQKNGLLKIGTKVFLWVKPAASISTPPPSPLGVVEDIQRVGSVVRPGMSLQSFMDLSHDWKLEPEEGEDPPNEEVKLNTVGKPVENPSLLFKPERCKTKPFVEFIKTVFPHIQSRFSRLV